MKQEPTVKSGRMLLTCFATPLSAFRTGFLTRSVCHELAGFWMSFNLRVVTSMVPSSPAEMSTVFAFARPDDVPEKQG